MFHRFAIAPARSRTNAAVGCGVVTIILLEGNIVWTSSATSRCQEVNLESSNLILPILLQ